MDKASQLLSERLQTFLLFCKTRSFVETAKQLGVSQSSVSRQIGTLEELFGAELVDRTSKPLSPTKDGHLLAQTIETQFEPIKAVIRDIQEHSSQHIPLRIGLLESLTTEVAPKLLAELDSHVGSTLCLTGTCDRLAHKFASSELDVIIVSRSFSELKDIRRHFIFGEPSILMLPSNIAQQHEKWTWTNLRFCGLPLIRYYHGSAGQISEHFLNSIGVVPPKTIEVDTTGVMKGLISQSMGWSITRASSLLPHKETVSSISLVPMPEPTMKRELYVIAKSTFNESLYRRIVSLLLKIFKEGVVQELLTIAPWVKKQLLIGDERDPNAQIKIFE